MIGAGVIDRGVVDALNNRLDTRRGEIRRIEAENGVLTGRNDQHGRR